MVHAPSKGMQAKCPPAGRHRQYIEVQRRSHSSAHQSVGVEVVEVGTWDSLGRGAAAQISRVGEVSSPFLIVLRSPRWPANMVGLRVRSPPSPATVVPSPSESSLSDPEELLTYTDNDASSSQQTALSGSGGSTITLHKIASSTAFKRRLSRQSSLSWGHKPSPIIGASCLLFMLPVPLLLRACCPWSAMSLVSVTFSSYLSDHVFTGLESWAHFLDRTLAPMALGINIYSMYSTCGLGWASLSIIAVKCHVLANYYSKKGIYVQFVIWHSLWHATGVGLIIFALSYNGVVGQCWEGSRWEDMFIMNSSR